MSKFLYNSIKCIIEIYNLNLVQLKKYEKDKQNMLRSTLKKMKYQIGANMKSCLTAFDETEKKLDKNFRTSAVTGSQMMKK